MSNQRVLDSLTALFATHQAVFWHDVDGEFASAVDSLQIDGVQTVRLDQLAALRLKIDIEQALRKGSGQRWLLYSNQPEPAPVDDWLLDVRLRAKSFRADSTSILLEDLGLESLSLAPHLKLR